MNENIIITELAVVNPIFRLYCKITAPWRNLKLAVLRWQDRRRINEQMRKKQSSNYLR